MTSFFHTSFKNASTLIEQCLNDSFLVSIETVAKHCIQTLEKGGKLLIAGNGGSASQAQHFATELVIRYQKNRRALPAMALTADSTILTAGANDLGYEQVFARQIEAFGKAGDLFVGLSTSGTSPSIVAAFQKAKVLGLTTVGFLGVNMASDEWIDFALHVPSQDTPRIQELHLLMIHSLCESIENHFSV